MACLGVTDGDWAYLGRAALNNRLYELATRVYSKLKDISRVRLAQRLAVSKEEGGRFGLSGFPPTRSTRNF